jgi:hypothetical protein
LPVQQAASYVAAADKNPAPLKASPGAAPPGSQPLAATLLTIPAAPAANARMTEPFKPAASTDAAYLPAEKAGKKSEAIAPIQPPIKEPLPGEAAAANKAIKAPELGCYSIQVEIFYKRKNALKFQEEVQKKGFAASIVRLPDDVRPFRVMIKRFQNREDALKFMKSENIKGKFPEALVQRFCPSSPANR